MSRIFSVSESEGTKCFQKKEETGLGRKIAYYLRHRPWEANLEVDERGYVPVKDLLNVLNISQEVLDYIVANDEKHRYSYNENKTAIRANQGHSFPVNLDLQEVEPPAYLYHGTSSRFISSIRNEGITKQSRQYVHLSKDIETATSVGTRHGGKLIILKIDTRQMKTLGYKLYLSENNVWLTEYVPTSCFEILHPDTLSDTF